MAQADWSLPHPSDAHGMRGMGQSIASGSLVRPLAIGHRLSVGQIHDVAVEHVAGDREGRTAQEDQGGR